MSFIDTALARRGATREAAKFARSVKLNRPYYAVRRARDVTGGDTKLLHEFVFTHRSKITGEPMCDIHAASYIWLNYGPIHSRRPAGMATFEEYDRGDLRAVGPDPDYDARPKKKRVKQRA